ncbi:Protein MAINTENANCE OF MERISTEMS, partial [Bienertia sinuspersici]
MEVISLVLRIALLLRAKSAQRGMTLLRSFAAHVASYIWDNKKRDVLICHTRSLACEKLKAWSKEFFEPTEDELGNLGLKNLIDQRHYVGGGITMESIFLACRDEDDRAPETRAIDLETVKGYAWGAATLAYLYRQLGIASRNGCRVLTGCMTLLQAWIYEYFPCLRPHQERLVTLPNQPRAMQWNVLCEPKTIQHVNSFHSRLDFLTIDE